MTNREKYKEEILDIVCRGGGLAFSRDTQKIVRCEDINCAKCGFNISGNMNCRIGLEHWCNSEYKESEIDWSKVKVDTPIIVKNNEIDVWRKRHFAKYEDGLVYAWNCAVTSWSVLNREDVTGWKLAKLAESEE